MEHHLIDVAHIYHGAMGNNGLYMHEIVSVLEQIGLKQEVYVSYYYPKEYGKKYFFKYTDLSSGREKRWWRPYVRGCELIAALMKTFVSLKQNKPRVINYSLIQAFAPELLFLKLVKKYTDAKLIITCHDVRPFANNYISMEESTSLRRKMFALADYLLVHNESSKNDLIKYFDVPDKKIILHPFPLMDISQLYDGVEINSDNKSDFLFIGHMREEKGINILLEAWVKFHKTYPNATLTIAGNNPNKYDFSKYRSMGVNVIEGFLDDRLYCELIKSSRYTVLPYTHGTNSGVVSTVIGLGGAPICSDIPMFRDNEMVPSELIFQSNSSDALCEKMGECYVSKDCISVDNISKSYRLNFVKSVVEVYNRILGNV